MNYYNENDPFCVKWLRNLMAAGLVLNGVVDGRSIAEVQPEDLAGFRRIHLFGGVAGWDYALNLAGWGDAPVWTGSCPCQPFSQAGKRKGTADKRHLWPEFLRLITECRPATIFGEQVASKAGREWLSGVRVDLEALGYAVGAADLCAAGAGAPHIRQRLFWVADTAMRGHGTRVDRSEDGKEQAVAGGGLHEGVRFSVSGDHGNADGLADTGHNAEPVRPRNPGREARQRQPERGVIGIDCEADGVGNTDSGESPQPQEQPAREELSTVARASGHYVHCRDSKTRRVPDPESGIQPLAYGIPRKLGPPLTGMGQVGIRAARANRVGRLRGYGNAIVPELAAEFVRAYLDITEQAEVNRG